MKKFSALPKSYINTTTPSRQRRELFHSFLSDDSKQDSATTNSHSKRFISLLKEENLFTTSLSKIWENTDGCAKQYRYAAALYLMLFMSHCYSIIIHQGISVPGHGKEVVDGLNAVDKRCINN